jgi:hypothetical protein
MWRLLSVLTLCGMAALWADVCGGLPASPPQRLRHVEALRIVLLPFVRVARHGGFTGANLERPALQQLLEDIDGHRVRLGWISNQMLIVAS